MKYTDKQRISKIYDYATKLKEYINENNVTKDELINDIHIQWLVTTPLYNIGELTYNLSDEFKAEHGAIEWNMIAGLRHRLVHDYDGTNWNIIADIVYEEIPDLITKLEELL